MNYPETLDYLFGQLPMYQRIGNAAYKANLDNTYRLSEILNHPEKQFKSVHIAGTNGKGSTSHMLASVLQEAGYKVGLYTSPVELLLGLFNTFKALDKFSSTVCSVCCAVVF